MRKYRIPDIDIDRDEWDAAYDAAESAHEDEYQEREMESKHY